MRPHRGVSITPMKTDVRLRTDGGNMRFYTTSTDRSPIEATLLENDEPIDLSDARRVRFRMYDRSECVIDKRATIVDDENGLVEYDWSKSDPLEGGVYRGLFIVKDSGRNELSYPNYRKFEIVVERA